VKLDKWPSIVSLWQLVFNVWNKDKLAEIRHGWMSLLIFSVLCLSHEVVGRYFSNGWAVVTALSAVALWIILRPWNFGLLPLETRAGIRLMGIVALAGFALITLKRYWLN
jgi:hypothetical protein